MSAPLAGRRVGVWGAGREGQAAARHALQSGAGEVILHQDEEWTELPPPLLTLRDTGVRLTSGAQGERELLTAELVICSPGISPLRPLTEALEHRGVTLTSGTELFFAAHPEQIIAVTGTKGKSTTASLTAALLRACGLPCTLAGNIGVPLLALSPAPHEIVVAEVSSYQTARLVTPPRTAVLTSLFPDHLTWHGGVEEYYRDKLRLAAGVDAPGHSVLVSGVGRELVTRLPTAERYGIPGGVHMRGGVVYDDDLPLLDLPVLPLRGNHNLVNLCGALAGTRRHLGEWPDLQALRRGVEGFQPLAHRLECVRVRGGVRWVDDTLSTTPHSTVAALEAFPQSFRVLIAGGHDRGVSHEVLVSHLRQAGESVGVITWDASGERLSRECAEAGVSVSAASSLEDAVERAAAATAGRAGSVVLLSPAAPSHGTYADYQDKASAFVAAVDALSEPGV